MLRGRVTPGAGLGAEIQWLTPPSKITELLVRWRGGDQVALDALVPLVYTELRQIAQHYLQGAVRSHPAKHRAGARSLCAAGRIFREAMTTFQELSPETSSNRYKRSGLADSYSGLGRAYSALATAPHLSVKRSAANWNEARAWYEKSLTVWIDKERRGELENDERDERRIAIENIARCDAAIHRPFLDPGARLATQATARKTH